ncbi:MAG TPA: class I SAM-dependent methyltransferase [Frankiaceae bacterium]|jgi:caffeoyl-CoA O-methyltransferase|nr:class I SAM-dependent methyltransferase [Frankiaceae bacterium]
MGQSFFLSEELQAYLWSSMTPTDDILADLRAETAASLSDVAQMQIAPEQGAFLTTLATVMGARRIIEVGTFTGYSALCLARGLASGGLLQCFDVNEEWTSIARRYWDRAGVADRIELTLGPAAESLAALAPDPLVDMAFVDADKTGYPGYVELLLPRLRPGGLLMLDNTLRSGHVLPSYPATDEGTLVMIELNKALAADPRVDVVMLPLADGLTIARKR